MRNICSVLVNSIIYEQTFVNIFPLKTRTYFLNICLLFLFWYVKLYIRTDIITFGGIYMSQGKISKKQLEILEYIKEQILSRGYPPAVREICEAVNLKSTSSVHSHLETLEKNGYIRRDPTKPRAIEIIDDTFNLTRREMVQVPIIGCVAAGEPLLAQENIQDYFPIPVDFMPNKDTFMLEVKGESMINAGILNGDYVLVEKDCTAQNGDMVVALIEDGATVKTFYKEEGIYRLQPENDFMSPIIVKQVEILGKVIGVFRFMR